MALSILSSLFSQAQFLLTDKNGDAQMASNAKVVSVRIMYASRLHRHMKEDGSSIVDARTIMPTRLRVEMIAPDLDTLDQITQVAQNRSSAYIIKSKGLVFDNMMVEDECISQVPKMLSASPVRLEFKQQLVQWVMPVIYSQSSDSSVIDRGFAALNGVTTSVNDLVTRTKSLF